MWVGARKFEHCRYNLFVESSRYGRSRVRLPAPDKFSSSSLRHDARPIALVRVDSLPGREIAVKLLQGASVRPFGFFTMRRGAVIRMDIEAEVKPLAAENMFAFGGGLSMMFATDCVYAKYGHLQPRVPGEPAWIPLHGRAALVSGARG